MATRKKSRNKAGATPRARKRPPVNNGYDVIIVGAGPAGNTLAWKLASAGVKTIVLDGARFPREKVCGDYIEPRGLRLLDQMGCLSALEADSPLPIAYSSTYVDSERRYIGRIPFYGVQKHLPPHGYIISREILDNVILERAQQAGAVVRQETYVQGFSAVRNGVTVEAKHHGNRVFYRGRIIVGADGTNSVVARCAGILVNDSRHIALSQRAYAYDYDGRIGEAAFFFDRDYFPGYGWMFPMNGGRVNLGVGVLKETCQRHNIAIPKLFHDFFEKLKRWHPRCRKLKLLRPPIGGIVKTYGGAGCNYFQSGLLIGDAGSFVDPMTGEGIAPAMESALIAAHVILSVLSSGRVNASSFASYETAFRNYFDPSMAITDLCAATLRNPYYWNSWKRALLRGCALAQNDLKFAATVGACFGGLEINPAGILSEIWIKTVESLLNSLPQSMFQMLDSGADPTSLRLHEAVGWVFDSWASILHDPFWHAAWIADIQRKWLHVLSVMQKTRLDPRISAVV